VRRLLLIAPSQRTGGRALFPPLSLGAVAALTPDDWEVSITDEAVEPVDFDAPADLVGITVISAAAESPWSWGACT